MKTVALAVLVVLSVSLGVLLAQEKAQMHRLTVRLAELESQDKQHRAEIQAQSQQVASLSEEKTRLAAKVETAKQKRIAARENAQNGVASVPAEVAVDSAAKAEEEARGAAKAEKSSGQKGNPFKGYLAGVAKMMKDPAMKQMMRSTQSASIRQMYGDLVKQWGMSPEKSGKFYDLLLDRQMDTIDRSMNASETGSASEARATALANGFAESDAQLKAAIGDNYFQQYKDYEKTVGDRMLLNQYQQRLAADNAPALTAEQSQYLIRTMSEVRQSQAATGDASATANPFVSQDGSFNLDQAAADKYLQRQTAINEQVAQRAAGTLSAQQLDSFKQYQKQMLDMQRVGIEMAAKMNDGGGKP